MYLVDTNIFIEGLLGQEKAKDVQAFLQNISLDNIFMTDLSFHSIGIILFRLQKVDLFLSFINDMIVDGLEILSLSHEIQPFIFALFFIKSLIKILFGFKDFNFFISFRT